MLSEEILEQLRPSPFHAGVAERILQLLRILHRLAQETREYSSLSPAGMELYQMHFVGGKAFFTDEHQCDKNAFESELTFRDPRDRSRTLFCSWHGKARIGQFRTHFEWQRPPGQREIKVAYIGPKITKH